VAVAPWRPDTTTPSLRTSRAETDTFILEALIWCVGMLRLTASKVRAYRWRYRNSLLFLGRKDSSEGLAHADVLHYVVFLIGRVSDRHSRAAAHKCLANRILES